MNRTLKIFINTFRTLSFKKIMKLCKVILPHPILAALSFYATIRSYLIAKKFFPKTNSNNGIGNAFRHALWCGLIMMYCCKITSPKKAYRWCHKITNLHEELFPNEPLETKMDLHNNTVGMEIFMQMLPEIHRQFFEKSFLIDAIFEKLKSAKLLRNLDDDCGNNLVYLSR